MLKTVCTAIAVACVACATAVSDNQSYVAVELAGQLGNQFFQLAAGYAYALDTGARFIVPDLLAKKEYNIQHNRKRLFNYIEVFHQEDLPTENPVKWNQPSFKYTPIPALKNYLTGYFQSEKYILHRRKEIIAVLSPPLHIQNAILSNHTVLTSGKYTVGVQVRDYRKEQPLGKYHPTLQASYYDKAMARFPDDAVFIITSNNEAHARHVTKKYADRAMYLTEDDGDYIDHFYILNFCKAVITANSSYGWWAAWLSDAIDRIVIMPRTWFAAPYRNLEMSTDLYPSNCIIIDDNSNRY
jgi:hypothetical protein